MYGEMKKVIFIDSSWSLWAGDLQVDAKAGLNGVVFKQKSNFSIKSFPDLKKKETTYPYI